MATGYGLEMSSCHSSDWLKCEYGSHTKTTTGLITFSHSLFILLCLNVIFYTKYQKKTEQNAEKTLTLTDNIISYIKPFFLANTSFAPLCKNSDPE